MATTVTKTSSDSPSAAVERALAMLEAVAQGSPGLSNAEISRKLAIPKSSASYILRTLETRGYLTRDAESGKYRVGLKILSLSRGALAGRDVRGVALPVMLYTTFPKRTFDPREFDGERSCRRGGSFLSSFIKFSAGCTCQT